MNFDYIKQAYSVPAEYGRLVIVNGKPGIIIKDMGNYIGVNFDGDKPGLARPCHPTWEVTYGEIGTPRKPTRSQQRYQKYLDVSDCFENFKHFLQYKR